MPAESVAEYVSVYVPALPKFTLPVVVTVRDPLIASVAVAPASVYEPDEFVTESGLLPVMVMVGTDPYTVTFDPEITVV